MTRKIVICISMLLIMSLLTGMIPPICFDLTAIKRSVLAEGIVSALSDTEEMKQAELEAKVAEVIASEITDNMSDYEKALALHDWLIDNMVYQAVDEDVGTDYTAYDAIVLGRGVCHGYAMGYAELLNAVGINNAYELGTDHIWNMIELDGQWYHVDCTWDDNDSGANTYFCLPNAAIQAVDSHECEVGEHIGTDYSMSYLYRYGLLDSKISGVVDKIQQQFDLGVYEFIFSPSPSLLSANGNGWNDSAVELALLEMILADTEFIAGGEAIEPVITMDRDANTVSVVAEGPEISIPEEEEPEDPDEVFTFISNGENSRYYLDSYIGTAQRVIIPDGVVEISGYAFQDCITMREIVFPDSLKKIKWSAFEGCINLRSVTLPPNLTELGSDAFAGCTNLTSVTLPNSLLSLGSYAFEDCTALTSVVLPDSLTSLSFGVFQECFALKSLTLPSKITEIPSYLCLQCSSLESIVIPSGVTNIGYRAFDECSSLASLTLNEGLVTIDDHCFGGLAISELELPSTLTSIGEWGFEECINLRKVFIPQGMTEISRGSFYGCSSLEEVSLPEGITSIGVHAFNLCGELVEITLPSTLNSIGTYAFQRSSKLTKLFIPASVTSIGNQPFPGNIVLLSAADAYTRTWAQENGIAWEHDIHTQDIMAAKDATCTEPGYTEGLWCAGCGEIFTQQTEIAALGHTEVIDAAVPATHVTAGLTEGSHCSVCNTELVVQEVIPVVEISSVLTLPAALKVIEDKAFEGGTFACVVIPDGCVCIEAYAFKNCAQLQFIEIPSSVISIDSTALDGCGENLVIVASAGSEAVSFAESQGMICVIR